MYWALVSLLPTLENRAGIPLAIFSGVDPFFAWIVSSFLSFLGGFTTYLLLRHVEPLLLRTPLRGLYSHYISSLRRRAKKYEKWEALALPLFVAVPLPGSGAYTGALLAYLLGLKKGETALGLFLGTYAAGLLVLTASVSLRVLV